METPWPCRLLCFLSACGPPEFRGLCPQEERGAAACSICSEDGEIEVQEDISPWNSRGPEPFPELSLSYLPQEQVERGSWISVCPGEEGSGW